MRWLQPVFTLLFAAPCIAAAQSAVVHTDQVRAELVAHAPRGLRPGEPAWLGLAIAHQPHWHSYWKNPGDSGMATTLRWTLPEGVTAGPIEWPTPQRLPVGPLVNYGYEGDVLLPVALALPAAHQGATLEVKLHAQWLVCKDVCIPQSGEFTLKLPSAASTLHVAAFARGRAATPQPLAGATVLARVQGQDLSVDVSGLPAPWRGTAAQFFAEDAAVIDHAAPVQQHWEGAVLQLRVPLSAQRSESPQSMRAVLVAAGEPSGVALNFAVEGGWPVPGGAPPQVQAPEAAAAAAATETAAPAAPAMPLLTWLVAILAALALGAFWALRRARRAEPRKDLLPNPTRSEYP